MAGELQAPGAQRRPVGSGDVSGAAPVAGTARGRRPVRGPTRRRLSGAMTAGDRVARAMGAAGVDEASRSDPACRPGWPIGRSLSWRACRLCGRPGAPTGPTWPPWRPRPTAWGVLILYPAQWFDMLPPLALLIGLAAALCAPLRAAYVERPLSPAGAAGAARPGRDPGLGVSPGAASGRAGPTSCGPIPWPLSTWGGAAGRIWRCLAAWCVSGAPIGRRLRPSLDHELAHCRRGDVWLAGVGSPFEALVRLAPAAYLILVLAPLLTNLGVQAVAAAGGIHGDQRRRRPLLECPGGAVGHGYPADPGRQRRGTGAAVVDAPGAARGGAVGGRVQCR